MTNSSTVRLILSPSLPSSPTPPPSPPQLTPPPLTELFKNAILLIRESLNSESMDQVLQLTMEGDPTALEEMQARQSEKSTELNREVLEQLWTAYDADSNGILSAEENRLLVREYLEASKVHLPKLLEESLKVSLELGMSMLDDDMAKEMKKEMKRIMKTVKSSLVDQVAVVLDEMLADADTVADDLLALMDVDGDGMVEKHEFVDKFLEASSSLVRPERFQAATQSALAQATLIDE